MRFLVYLLIILGLAFGGWTYFNLYRLTEAVSHGDDEALARYVDLDSIRTQHVNAVTHALGMGQPSGESLIQRSVEAVTNQAANNLIDLQWVKSEIGRPTGGKPGLPSFAFYESPFRMLLRYGELGHEPVHAYFCLQNWRSWRLTQIYE